MGAESEENLIHCFKVNYMNNQSLGCGCGSEGIPEAHAIRFHDANSQEGKIFFNSWVYKVYSRKFNPIERGKVISISYFGTNNYVLGVPLIPKTTEQTILLLVVGNDNLPIVGLIAEEIIEPAYRVANIYSPQGVLRASIKTNPKTNSIVQIFNTGITNDDILPRFWQCWGDSMTQLEDYGNTQADATNAVLCRVMPPLCWGAAAIHCSGIFGGPVAIDPTHGNNTAGLLPDSYFVNDRRF